MHIMRWEEVSYEEIASLPQVTVSSGSANNLDTCLVVHCQCMPPYLQVNE